MLLNKVNITRIIKNKKTSIPGILAIMAVVVWMLARLSNISIPFSEWMMGVAIISAGVGSLNAKDDDNDENSNKE